MREDPHSFADLAQARTSNVELDLRVDFTTRMLAGEAVLRFAAAAQGRLDLDTRDLAIESVADLAGTPIAYTLHTPEPILGARLSLRLPSPCLGVRIRYATSPEATALQWLAPSQTAGQLHPFLYSQCQPIHARSLAPLQDTPRARVQVRAAFTVPAMLRARMGAAFLGRGRSSPGLAVDRFELPQPIPPYLIAFAVGDLAERALSPRTSIWAEPEVLEAAAWEFAETPRMLETAEALFGPYDWDRYDVLVLPKAFPYGGMENPRLTFATPSVLAGDRSLVSLIAHELAHAWTGNLVTNASANDFWLNEGFTVFAERRIVEALYGRERAELASAAGRHELSVSLRRFRDQPQLTRLRTDLSGVDPDQAYSSIPYEKGYLFLRRLEELAGRPAFDRFLRAYLARFRFQSITTAEFLAALEQELPGLAERARAVEWIDGPGLPADAPEPASARLSALVSLARAARRGALPSPDESALLARRPEELLVFLQQLAESAAPVPTATCEAIETMFSLHERKSLELRTAFLLQALRVQVPGAAQEAARAVRETGRMKFLRPLYGALARDPSTRALAEETYAQAKPGYHPIARRVIEGLLASAAAGDA
jgi:aminopeptidase N